MYCTACGSADFKTLSFVYTSGLRDIRTRTVGFGRSLYVGGSRGISQSRLSQIAAPPRPRRYAGLVILWLIMGYVGGFMIFAAISMNRSIPNRAPIVSNLGAPQRPVGRSNPAAQQNSQPERRNQTLAQVPVQRSAGDDLMIETFLFVVGAAYLLLLFILLRGVNRYNRNVYSKAIQKWNSSFMCQICGQIAERAQQQHA